METVTTGVAHTEEVISLEDEEKQRVFYASVRETIISLLLVVLLYLLSYWLVAKFKRHRTKEECYSGEDDAMVYRVATWLCSFAICISLGSAFLLPLSIVGNEIVLHYPNSRYMQWLNTSLIQGLWNQIFLGCNLSLFFLLPFAFFFTESEGLAGSRKGLMSRVYETVLLVFLMIVMALLMVAVLTSIFFSQDDQYSFSWWLSYFPFLYSLVSMVGVAMMVVCTPLGFSALFTVLGDVITKPMIYSNVKDEIEMLQFEELCMHRRYKLVEGMISLPARLAMEEGANLKQLQQTRKALERQRDSSPWERNFLYPLCFVLLLAVTLLALALVATNIFCLIFYPSEHLTVQEYLLGRKSTSQLGALGACLEVGLIIYLLCASVVGVYSTPQLHWLIPTKHDTPMTMVIANSIVLLMLSSALPLLAWTLGITRFGLLGYFRQLGWLRNGWLLLCYNFLFFLVTSAILSNRVSRSVMKEVSQLLGSRINTEWRARTRWITNKHKKI